MKDVKSALWNARAKWRNTGSCIGVDEGTLDTMKGKDDDCFGEMLNNWLRGVYKPGEKNSKSRTWHTLIEALRDKIVNIYASEMSGGCREEESQITERQRAMAFRVPIVLTVQLQRKQLAVVNVKKRLTAIVRVSP